jgi:hypothetical protein
MHVDEAVKGSGLIAKVIPCSKFKDSQSRRYMWCGSNNGNKCFRSLMYREECYHHYVAKTYCDIYEGKDPNIAWPYYELWCIIQSWRSWYLDAILCKCHTMDVQDITIFVYSWARTRCNLSKGKTFHQIVQSNFFGAVFYMIIGVNCGIIYALCCWHFAFIVVGLGLGHNCI